MTISMYAASAPRFIHMLKNLQGILDKAEAHAAAKKIDPAVLLAARLFPDMFPLTKQVQITTDHAKGAVARLAGLEVPRFEDNEQTFADLRERIAKTIRFIESVNAAQFEGAEDRDITIKVPGREFSFKGTPYLLGYALPNFHFHLVTAYNILRHNGVDIGKADYIGAP